VPGAVFGGDDSEAKATEGDLCGRAPQLLLDARRKLRREDHVKAVREAIEVGIELDRLTGDDQRRLEDAHARVRSPVARRHRGILPARPGRC
jgi:hypothetical protein